MNISFDQRRIRNHNNSSSGAIIIGKTNLTSRIENDNYNNISINKQSKLMHNPNELVVNQVPKIPLKVSLDHKNPELFLNQKILNLDKMTQAMVKLDNMADESKNKFEFKLKERRKKVMKLKELIEMEDFEREKRIFNEKERQKNAI